MNGHRRAPSSQRSMKITVTVPPDIYDRLKYAAWSSSSSKGAVVTAALNQALPKVPNTLTEQQPPLIPEESTTHTIGFIPLRKNGLIGHGVCSCGSWRSSKTGSREATQAWGNLHSRRSKV